MMRFEMADLVTARERAGRPYHEFLRVPALSAGVYMLPAGGTDPQEPHTEDEVYYVVAGAGRIAVAGEDAPVQAGSLVFVPAHVPHHFHAISAGLTILVFFAPAEYSARAAKAADV